MKKFVMILACVLVLGMFSACQTETKTETEDKYAGKTCIYCGGKATGGTLTTGAFLEALFSGQEWPSTAAEKRESIFYMMYFCDECFSKLPVSSPYDLH